MIGRAPLLVLCAAAGCGGDFSDDAGLVSALRLLAVVAAPPEATPGAEVALAALAVDPRPGAAPTIAWAACLIAPVAGSGTIHPACVTADDDPDLVPLGQGASILARLPAFDPDPAPGPAVLGPPDATSGVYLPLRLRLASLGERLDGVYRLRITTAASAALGAANRNPTIARVEQTAPVAALLGPGAPAPVTAGTTVSLRAVLGEGSAESYRTAECADPATPPCRTESLSISWFATAGHLDPGSTGDGVETRLQLGQHPPAAGALIDLWAVARDGRGGSDVAHRQLRVQAPP